MRASFSLAALTVATFAAGCSNSSLSPNGPSQAMGSTTLTAGQVAGTWAVLSIQPAGQAEQPAPAGVSYALTLADGAASTRADCNVCAGNLMLGAGTLTIGPLLACTRAACPTMGFENAYVSILAGESAARIEGNSLALTSPRGVLRFQR